MKLVLVATLLTGVMGVTAANAQARMVDLRMKNGFDKPVTIYVIDWNNGKKVHENKNEITPGGEGSSKAALKDDMMDVVFSLKAPGDGKSTGYYCKRVTTSMKGRSQYSETLTKSSMKEGSGC
jgi:hypothetical protein